MGRQREGRREGEGGRERIREREGEGGREGGKEGGRGERENQTDRGERSRKKLIHSEL